MVKAFGCRAFVCSCVLAQLYAGFAGLIVLVSSALVCRCKAAQAVFQLEQQARSSSSGGGKKQDTGAAEALQDRLAQAKQVSSQLGRSALLKKLAALDQHIGKLYQALPANGVLIVATGQGDTSNVVWQMELRCKRQQLLDGFPRWTTTDEESYAALCEAAVKGLCFCAVKQ